MPTVKWYVCREKGCVGVTEVEGGQCNPHARGFKKHPKHGGGDIHCVNCRRRVLPETWYRVIDNQIRCCHDCKPHKDVLAAQNREQRLSKT